LWRGIDVAFNPFDKPIGQLAPADLEKLIEDRVEESWTIEYKSDFAFKDSGEKVDGARIARNIASFANSPFGGWLIIGIEEKDEKPTAICGLTHSDPETVIASIVREHIDPVPIFHIQRITVDGTNGDKVLVVYVPGEQDSPFINRDGNVYRRTNDSSHPVEGDTRVERVKGRHELDTLTERGRRNIDDFVEFCKDERVLVAPQYEKSVAWLDVYVSPYPLGGVNKLDLLQQEHLDSLIQRTQEKISVTAGIPNPAGEFVLDKPFYRGHPGYRSVVLRDSTSAGVLDFAKMLEIFVDGRVKQAHLEKLGVSVTDPDLVKIRSHDYGEGKWPDAGLGPVPELAALHFFDFGELWTDVLWLLVFYQECFKDEALLRDIRIGIIIRNPNGYLVPFETTEEWVMKANQSGLPIMKNRLVTIPDGIKDGMRMEVESVNVKWMFYIMALLSTAFGLHASDLTIKVLRQGEADLFSRPF
jgi:hypothetical protein